MGRRDRDEKNEDIGFAMGQAMRGVTYEEMEAARKKRHEELYGHHKDAKKVRFTTGSAEFKQWCRKARVKLKVYDETEWDGTYKRTQYRFSGNWGAPINFHLETRNLTMQALFRMNMVVPEGFIPESIAERARDMLKASDNQSVPTKAIVGNSVSWHWWKSHPMFRGMRIKQLNGVLSYS